ncbi:hypothetical protein WJX81_004577 [Elliptochloris bilobata]|uniref:Uncharacterized protein n=1 Tax=Elliptochloris bilobata TaxID=381761 RepID=A0AAW1RXL3_9CHLO
MEVIRQISRFSARPAVVAKGLTFRYHDILAGASSIARDVHLATATRHKLQDQFTGPRVAIYAPPGRHYVEATWGAWLAGGIAVPLCLTHPHKELQYVLDDAQVAVLLTTPEHEAELAPLAHQAGADLRLLRTQERGVGTAPGVEQLLANARPPHSLAQWPDACGALIVYTSGTTGRPKGALHTHGSLAAHVSALVDAWAWREDDRILHALPLHHVHGVINALHCAHAAGAAVEFLPNFSPAHVWGCLMREEDAVTVFMGVPTMYAYLLNAYDAMAPAQQAAARAAAARLRLTVSGSAACPLPTMQRWEELSGQRLLERYGMTETNMILSNPYEGERRPGSVGLPLPGVEVRAIADPAYDEDSGAASSDGVVARPGELRVRGPNLFREYWNQPDATAEAFDEDGWFRTGDTGVLDGSPPYWRILGRSSVDIIKSGGYKISALGVENVLLAHPRVAECAVVGLPDDMQGERVVAIIAYSGEPVTLEELQRFTAGELPAYQLPRQLRIVDGLPRNAMGKVNKKQLVRDLFAVEPAARVRDAHDLDHAH